MKRAVVIVLLIVFVLDCAPVLPQYERPIYDGKNALVISERIGEIIDPEERKQFDLFHGIKAFKEARLFEFANGGYVLEITTDNGRLVSVNHDQDAIMILRDYIDTYEKAGIDRAAFARKWKVLDYDTLGIPITESEVNRLMERSRGRAVQCCLASCGIPAGIGFVIGLSAQGSDGTGIGAAFAQGMGLLAFYLGVAVGLASGAVVYFTTQENEETCMRAIKEARKPRPVE